MAGKPKHLLDRLADKFLVGDGCWEWVAAKNAEGYGKFGVTIDGRHRTRRAHRVLYELLVGPIPAGLDLDHLCRNRACVRPDHLEPVTRSVNLLRGLGPRITSARMRTTHCKYGHPWDEKNTSWWQDKRQCRICRARRSHEAYTRLTGRPDAG